MKLTFDTIKRSTHGAVRVVEDNGIHFYRFTKAQEEAYLRHHPDLAYKTHSTACVYLEFITDSKSITIDADFKEGSSRTFYCFDVLEGGKLIERVANYNAGDRLLGNVFNIGNLNKTINLTAGEKTVRIVFPWSVGVTINSISVDDGARVEPTPQKADKMLIFGDSITHGYDAARPTEAYSYMLGDSLNVEFYNKAIGGEVFFPELLDQPDDFQPKYVSVAYGTNDWSCRSYEQFTHSCREFYKRIATLYPNAKVFAITPTWRNDIGEIKPMGEFNTVRDFITEIAKDYPNMMVIEGVYLVPNDVEYFSDRFIHPDSIGFAHYFRKLSAEIEKYKL